jgi:hypothetical protein
MGGNIDSAASVPTATHAQPALKKFGSTVTTTTEEGDRPFIEITPETLGMHF